MQRQAGVLLVNLGSPTAASSRAVRKFLREFLADARVVETPRWLWFIILNTMVLPFRPRKSAASYRKIWRADGSPLIVYSQALSDKLAQKLAAQHIEVACAMRYGEPSISAKLTELQQRGCERILVLPMYPQYSATTSATIVDECGRALLQMRNQPELRYIKDFHAEPAYIDAMAQHLQNFWQQHGRAQKLLLSFHGLPQSYVAKGDPYRQQCELTAALLAERLGLHATDWQLSFQSRFGREHWLQPYTDQTLMQLGYARTASIDVFCPGFSADCLETLEEIAILGKSQFVDAGGGQFRYISALNDSSLQLNMLATLLRANL